jgi:kynurenine formamidase
VLLRTGWWERHRDDPAYFADEPGLSDDGAAWLAERDVVAVGADNYGVEVQPSPPGSTFPVHLRLLHRHGVLLLENLDLAALGRAEAAEFLFVASGLALAGSTAAPAHPIAIL